MITATDLDLLQRVNRAMGRMWQTPYKDELASIEELLAAYTELLLAGQESEVVPTEEAIQEIHGSAVEQEPWTPMVIEEAEPAQPETAEEPTRICIKCRDRKPESAFRAPNKRKCHECEKADWRAKRSAQPNRAIPGAEADETPTVDLQVKTCLGCGEEKSLDEFHHSKQGLLGRASRCRACVAIKDAERWRDRKKPARTQAQDEYAAQVTCRECGKPGRVLCARCAGKLGGHRRAENIRAREPAKPRRYHDRTGQVWEVRVATERNGQSEYAVFTGRKSSPQREIALEITDGATVSREAAQAALDAFAKGQGWEAIG